MTIAENGLVRGLQMEARPQNEVSDEELVRRCQRELPNNKEAFTMLVYRYRGYAYRLAVRYCRVPEDAEDIVQEAFIRVYFHIHKFRQESTFKTWLTRIVINLCLTYQLAQSRRARYFLDIEHEPRFDLIEQSLVSEPQEHRFWQMLGEILRRMYQEYRKVFIWRYLKNRPFRFIAERLNTTVNGAKMKVYRAKHQFLQIFQRLFGESQ